MESKIAAVPSVVSDFGFNAEIVENDVSGVVLRENTVDGLVEAIEMLDAIGRFSIASSEARKSLLRIFSLRGFSGRFFPIFINGRREANEHFHECS